MSIGIAFSIPDSLTVRGTRRWGSPFFVDSAKMRSQLVAESTLRQVFETSERQRGTICACRNCRVTRNSNASYHAATCT